MTKEIYNEFFNRHGANIHTDPIRFGEITKLCKGAVLDIGCGTGDLSDFYRGDYTGLDISNVAIDLARITRRKEASFLILNATKPIVVPEKCFDTIVMAEFLEHIENDEVVFENIRKWAKSDTRLIISVPNGDRVPDQNHLREFTVPELRKKFSVFGKVRFHNWAGFNKRILMTVDFGEKNENIISLSMIVWNEVKGLERCILSTIEFIDNVVISVDNKSDDGTLEIAKRYADVLKHHEWKQDFAAARNYAQEGIISKWILQLDGHEYVKEYPKINEMLKANVDGLMITMKMDGGDTFVNPRIFRGNIKWKHAIHNAITCKTLKKYNEFIIVHDRVGGQNQSAIEKRRDQLQIMMEKELKKELKIKEYKERALFYLARYYRTFGKWKKAIKYYKKYLKKGRHKGEKWLVAYEASTLANALGKHFLALRFLKTAEKIIPNRWETVKHVGLTYMAFEQWEKAIDFLVDSFKINTGDFSFNPEKRDDADTWDKIGYCFFQMKRYRPAKVAWESAIEKEEDPDKIKLNEKRIELMDRKLII